jgi:transcriptional regulator with XRE-family HTH domain
MDETVTKPRGRRQAIRVAPTGWGRLRQRLGRSLRDLEEETGIGRGTLSRIEQAPFPSPRDAHRLLAFYEKQGITFDE